MRSPLIEITVTSIDRESESLRSDTDYANHFNISIANIKSGIGETWRVLVAELFRLPFIHHLAVMMQLADNKMHTGRSRGGCCKKDKRLGTDADKQATPT